MPSWTHFCLQNCLNSSWHRFNKEILVHIDMIASCSFCRFVVCTSMMWISRSTTSQSCSIGLRSGDCGGHLSKMQTSTPHHYTTNTSLNHWDKAGWSMLSCFLCQIQTLSSECRSRNRDSSDQATFFQSSIVQFWWVCGNCILRFLFLSDRSGTRCGLLLLEPICFRVRRVVCSEMYSADLGRNEWLFELLLSFYHL